MNVKLKQFYLTLHYKVGRLNDFRWQNSFDELIIGINQFSLSLICLSLNLIYLPLRDLNEIPFNSLKLQQFLEAMRELKQFHLNAKLIKYSIDHDKILSRFQNQFWFDHNWLFGMHGHYLYTLPFHFHSLYEIDQDFDGLKSTNLEILSKNHRIWFNVKSIQLEKTFRYNSNWIKQINIKMPKLTSIAFGIDAFSSNIKSTTSKDYAALNNVTTIRWIYECLENVKEWFIYGLPNLKHFILSYGKMSSIDNELVKIFNERIQRLDIDWYTEFEPLTQITYNYFSNVQYIYYRIGYVKHGSKERAHFIMTIVKNFKNLKTLTIYILSQDIPYRHSNVTELDELIRYLDINEIIKKYQVKKLKNIFHVQTKTS